MHAPRRPAPDTPEGIGAARGPDPDPNLDNPNRSPLEPSLHDPFVITEAENPMPVQNPTPGGVPPAPVTDE